MSAWLYFLPHSYVFVLKLRESLLKSLKITSKKIVKFVLSFREKINSPKNSFWKNFAKNDFHKTQPAYLEEMTTTTCNNTHLFSLLSVDKFKRVLFIKHMVNAS